jgi:nitrite reductase/ring-hydroxylating ferredoxin subunit
MSKYLVEISRINGEAGLADRVLNGTVIVLRNGLQQLGLFEPLVAASLEGIRASLGEEVARRVESAGFERIHEIVSPTDIPRMTDTVYASVRALATRFLDTFVPRVFPGERGFYFEHSPNVRFHIPYDLAEPHRKQYDKFAKTHGQGKIAPHGPHRDSWLDCPDNAINLWIAVGPVVSGNGLSIFADDRDTQFSFRPNGEIAEGERMKPPLSFDLKPGDVLIFHSDALHASELNRTNATRFAISFRVTFGKPHFPRGHYHDYDHAGLARGGFRWLAGVPANLQWSYFAYQAKWLKNKLFGSKRLAEKASPAKPGERPSPHQDSFVIPLADLPVGTIRAVSSGIMVARMSEDQIVALSRRCPHKGADLTEGFVCDGEIVCPWHALHFDPETGASACKVLTPLRRYACDVKDNCVHISKVQESSTTVDA